MSASQTQIPISGFLASHFSADSISPAMIRESYAAAERVLLNPEKFPRADFDTLERLADELFMLSPTAACPGIPLEML